jgi:3-phenylpropionate/cinnamic acid dioxygenase small subunit
MFMPRLVKEETVDPKQAEALQELLDRDEISRVLVKFARALDEKDWDSYADLYAENGIFRRPYRTHEGREGLAELVQSDLGSFVGLHHITGNHDITVHGDSAEARSSLQAYHVRSEDLSDFWAVGGWYDMKLCRTESGWKITNAQPNPVWVFDTRRTAEGESDSTDRLHADVARAHRGPGFQERGR